VSHSNSNIKDSLLKIKSISKIEHEDNQEISNIKSKEDLFYEDTSSSITILNANPIKQDQDQQLDQGHGHPNKIEVESQSQSSGKAKENFINYPVKIEQNNRNSIVPITPISIANKGIEIQIPSSTCTKTDYQNSQNSQNQNNSIYDSNSKFENSQISSNNSQ